MNNSATYKIETYYRQGSHESWMATVVRLSDNWPVAFTYAVEERDAVAKARDWIAAETETPSGHTTYVDDHGHDATVTA